MEEQRSCQSAQSTNRLPLFPSPIPVDGESIVESFRMIRPSDEIDHSTVKLWAVDTE